MMHIILANGKRHHYSFLLQIRSPQPTPIKREHDKTLKHQTLSGLFGLSRVLFSAEQLHKGFSMNVLKIQLELNKKISQRSSAD